MRFVSSLLAVVAVMALLASLLIGRAGPLGVPIPLVLGALVLAVFLFRARAVRTVELGWSGAAVATAPAPVVTIPARPTSAPRTGGGSVARSLARVEARELVASPWFAVGIGFWLLLLATMGFLWVDDLNRSWWEFFSLATMMAHPFAGMAIVAAHRNRTRSTRDGCDELFDTCPAGADTRTLGHILTGWIGGLVCMAFLVVFVFLVIWRNERAYGPIDHEAAAAILACSAIGVGAVVLGATLGRWARFALTPFAAVGAVLFASAQINGIGLPGWATDRMLATFVASPGGIDTIFFTRPVWAHLAWIAALVVLVGALGVMGTQRRRRVELVAAGTVVVALVAAILVVQPASDAEAARIANHIVDPLAHQSCRAAGPGVRVCSYEEYSGLAALTADAVRPVAEALPPGAVQEVVFLTHFAEEPKLLEQEVLAAVAGRQPKLPENALRLRFSSNPENLDAARMRLAAFAVGLPTEAGEGNIGTEVAGEARGVLVLWLAAQGLDARRVARFAREAEGHGETQDDASDRGAIWPGQCSDEVSVIQWAPKDLAAARALLTLPAERVRRLLREQWDRLTAAATTTDELLVAAGLSPLGPPERIEAREYSC